MRFAAPQLLWLLILVGLPLLGFLWWAWRERQRLITQFISERLLAHLKVGVSAARQKTRLAMVVLAVGLFILAMARPQWGMTEELAQQRGVDIMVAVDTSNSMLAEDVSPNRLGRAKLAALDLAKRAKTDRLGLVAFAGSAFLECPLTLDDAAFSQSVSVLDTKTISQGGTALADAIQEAQRTFKKEAGEHKVLVLFTDGEDQDSGAVAAAKEAAQEGIIIFTVGVGASGASEGELLRIRDERGQMDYIRDERGQLVRSRLNEELLQQIASAGKGYYLHLRGPATMDQLYDQGIAPLPKSEIAARMFQRMKDRFQWPLGIAMSLLIAEAFLPDRKRRRSRSVSGSDPARTSLAVTTVFLLLLALPLPGWAGSPARALREYNQGNYEQSLDDYNQLLEKKADDLRLHFNAGAAAYQSRKLEDAVKQFGAAAASPDLQMQQRSYYNLGNSYYRLGEQLPDPQKKMEAWQNALKVYTNALALNAQDADAQFNREFVQQRVEELKKQQQQSKQNKSDQQNQKQDQKQDQDKSQKQQQQNQPTNSPPQQQKQDQAKDQQQKQDDQKSQPQQSGQSQQQKDQEAQKQPANPQGGDEKKDQQEEEARREAAMMAAGEMTPQQARQMLDAERDDEQVLRIAPPNKNTSQLRTLKNW